MAGLDDGDSFFGDDDLDALPEAALEELENNAIQFTQAQTQAARLQPPPSSDYGEDFDDEDLDDAVVIDQSRTVPSAPSYSNRNVFGQPPQRDQFRPQQHPNSSPILPNRQRPNPPPQYNQPNRYPPRPIIPQNDSMQVEQGIAPSTHTNSEVERLQSIIEEVLDLCRSYGVMLNIPVNQRTKCFEGRRQFQGWRDIDCTKETRDGH